MATTETEISVKYINYFADACCGDVDVKATLGIEAIPEVAKAISQLDVCTGSR